MESEIIDFNGFSVRCYSINTLITGSGAAALNAALNLHSQGQKNIIIVTEKWGGGTTRNAGSDKQTYYKLSFTGDEPDSAMIMAEDLFSGKCMHGDIALCEAQGSVQAFMNLVRLGVPFPQNKYGAWVGYKTDHDPRARGTSAGPYTSKLMFEALAKEIKRRKIKVINNTRVISILTRREGNDLSVAGALALNIKAERPEDAFILFNTVNIIWATGGPAGIYKDSVYPPSQFGSTGIALEAGATAQNLTESQFGIASVKFRWNLSGSYQQVIPRYFSTTKNGKGEKEFLNEFFPDLKTLTRAIFLKGYQWPFDPAKILNCGSSLIDLLVYREIIIKGRRVFLDYTKNPEGPAGEKFSLEILDNEIYTYLEKSDALKETPFKRLQLMNKPAIELYLDHNIDLSSEPLEIAVCVQHNNGGLKGNIWWESDLLHLFPVGEVNGSHGVYRPGGSALNSGQVGSYRAAYFITKKYNHTPPPLKNFLDIVSTQAELKLNLAKKWLTKEKCNSVVVESLKLIRKRMSETGGIMRNIEKTVAAVSDAYKMLNNLDIHISASSVRELAEAFRLKDHCLTNYVYLEALKKYLESGGRSRGSFFITCNQGIKPHEKLEDSFKFILCEYDREIENKILEVKFLDGSVRFNLTDPRPIPSQELWFEKVWKKNLEDKVTEC
ncbi:MAG: FAD-binding protein [Bacteroidales bacterium]